MKLYNREGLQTRPGLLVVMTFAKRLPVRLIPEQAFISSVRNDMVNNGGRRQLAFLHTGRT